jgi:hypothetical protein
MSNPHIIAQRAGEIGDLQSTFATIDAKRMAFLAEILEQCDRPIIADLARRWSNEYSMLADRLSGAVAIGADEGAAA